MIPEIKLASPRNYPDDEIGGMGHMFDGDDVDEERKSRAVWERGLAKLLEANIVRMPGDAPLETCDCSDCIVIRALLHQAEEDEK